MSHLGSRVSALVDGRLSAEEEERCWAHVHACHVCRDLVEQEGWVKTQLAQLSFGPAPSCRDLKSTLLGHGPDSTPAPHLAPARFPTVSTRSRRSLVAIGGGAASACVVGVLALGVAGTPRVEPRPPVTDLTRPASPASPVSPVSPVSNVDDRSARAPVSPSRTPLAERLVAIREKIAP